MSLCAIFNWLEFTCTSKYLADLNPRVKRPLPIPGLGAPRPMSAAPLAPVSRRSGQRLPASPLAPCSLGLVSPPFPSLVSTPPVQQILVALACSSGWTWRLRVGLLVLLKPLKLLKSVRICLGLAAGCLVAAVGLAWRSWASGAPQLSVCAVYWWPSASRRRQTPLRPVAW